MRSITGVPRRSHPRRWLATATSLAVAASCLAACSSTTTQKNGGAATGATIPQAAFSDHTGITSTTVTVGNVSTLLGGLFKGASIGTQAYAAYVNSTGGVNGRKLVVASSDDRYSGAPNKQATQAAISSDFAMVGSFSLQDNFGGTVLAANPQVPNVSVSLDLTTSNLANTFPAEPVSSGWQLGPLEYFKRLYPAAIAHTGALIADQPSATSKWSDEKSAMEHIGYKIVYAPTFDITQQSFTANVIAMRNAGVRILFLEQMPENYAAAVIKALDQQNFHPVVVLGAGAYSNQLVPNAGGAAAVNGAYLEQNTSLFLGEDASAIPAVGLFQSWVQKVSPGFNPDLYTLYGWISGQLFVQALRAAGPDPSRGSVLKALRSITSFSADDLIAPTNPAAKTPASCYIIARIVNGQFTRVDDPPVTGPTHGYRCDQPYYFPPGTKP